MKVLLINGSPHPDGNTATALREMMRVFDSEGVENELVTVGNMSVRGCVACNFCKKEGRCVFDDVVNGMAGRFREADGLVIGSPVYYASANGTLISLLDRLFMSSPFDKTMKVGAAVAVARRSGTTATFDELNKYFAISGMPVAGSSYWNNAYGGASGESSRDAEGMQTMRILARNMTFLMRSIALGIEKYGLPEKEDKIKTNFIR